MEMLAFKVADIKYLWICW